MLDDNKVLLELNKSIERFLFNISLMKESIVQFSIVFLIGALLLVTLTGCSSVKEVPVTIKSTEVKVVNLPEKLKETCAVPIPPNKDDYLKSTTAQKENLLTTYISELLTEINNCNKKIKAINMYLEESSHLYKK